MMKKLSEQKKQCIDKQLHATPNARIFIDAYNYIFQDPFLSKQPTMEQARDVLRELCGHYHETYPGHVVYLVFDGDSSIGLVPEKSKNQILNEKRGVREIYTESGETADDWIIKITAQIFPSDNLFVVTGDIDLSNAVAMHGAKIIPPEKFFKKKYRNNNPRRKDKGSSQSFSPRGQLEESDVVSTKSVRKIKDELSELFADQLDKPVDF